MAVHVLRRPAPLPAARARLEDAIEAAITLLDKLDPDPDLEPEEDLEPDGREPEEGW